jgi:fructose-bisphosphate aldolase class 1
VVEGIEQAPAAFIGLFGGKNIGKMVVKLTYPIKREGKVIRNRTNEMNAKLLMETAKSLMADGKGLLAMDESDPTCNKRFEKLGIPQTVEARRAYRELIVTTPGLGESISGAILYDDTIRQITKDGIRVVEVLTNAGIIPGIKVDNGADEMAGHSGEKDHHWLGPTARAALRVC